MSEEDVEKNQGLLRSLTTLAGTLVAIIHTRLDLLATDLEEDREHLLVLIVLALTALFCLGLGILLATILIVAAFWETHRLLTLVILTGIFLTAGIVSGVMAIHKTKTKPRIFATSLLELCKDRQHLDSSR
ncbi:MAG: phage holin family protein [Nitrosomonadales bacterium]|nr:phage holin family protein [Nitrosomonadales bacterium]